MRGRFLSKLVAGAAVLAIGAAGAGLGSQLLAGAEASDTVYYACLKNGVLSSVGTTAPASCPKGAAVIHWNEQGPAATPAPQTIYSSTFTPFMRMPDYDAQQQLQYVDPDGNNGPGGFPNIFIYNNGTGHDAWFNAPDLTIGATPMSAVSAEVCVVFQNGSGNAVATVYLGVQDKDRLFTVVSESLTDTAGQQCVTLTFDTPVQLVNGPHLVTVLDLKLKDYSDVFTIQGVTYTLQPTQEGDITPGTV